MQFLNQATRERRRLCQQRLAASRGRRQTLPWDVTVDLQANAENNVRRSWLNQGIWAKEWGPAWPEDSDSGIVRCDLDDDEVPNHPFRPLRPRPYLLDPFPNSWGHEEKAGSGGDGADSDDASRLSVHSAQMPDVGPPEKLIPEVRVPSACTPAAQFEYQVARERDWLQDEVNWQSSGPSASSSAGAAAADLDAAARESVRANWIADGIWRDIWDSSRSGGTPSGRWYHEIQGKRAKQPPLDEYQAILLAAKIYKGEPVGRWLSRAHAKQVSFCMASRWREVRAACAAYRPEVVSDDDSTEPEPEPEPVRPRSPAPLGNHAELRRREEAMRSMREAWWAAQDEKRALLRRRQVEEEERGGAGEGERKGEQARIHEPDGPSAARRRSSSMAEPDRNVADNDSRKPSRKTKRAGPAGEGVVAEQRPSKQQRLQQRQPTNDPPEAMKRPGNKRGNTAAAARQPAVSNGEETIILSKPAVTVAVADEGSRPPPRRNPPRAGRPSTPILPPATTKAAAKGAVSKTATAAKPIKSTRVAKSTVRKPAEGK